MNLPPPQPLAFNKIINICGRESGDAQVFLNFPASFKTARAFLNLRLKAKKRLWRRWSCN
jgi:hypothetical protein